MDSLCADKARAALKAHFADLWDKAHTVYNNTDDDDKEEVKQEIVALSYRIVYLINQK